MYQVIVFARNGRIVHRDKRILSWMDAQWIAYTACRTHKHAFGYRMSQWCAPQQKWHQIAKGWASNVEETLGWCATPEMIRTINNVTHTRALKEKLDDSLGDDIYFAMNEAKQLSFYDNAISEIAVKYDIPYMELS